MCRIRGAVWGGRGIQRVSGGIFPVDALDASFAESDGSVGLGGDGFVVSDHDDGEFLFVIESFEEIHDTGAGFGIEVSGGFIGEEDFGAGDESAGDGTALEFATGEFGGSMAEAVSESDFGKDRGGGFADFAAFFQVVEQGVPDHEWSHDVFEQRELGQQVIELEDEPEDMIAKLVTCGGGEVIDAVAIEQYFADVGSIEESHDVQERAFAGTALSDDGDEFSALRSESGTSEHGHFEGAFAVGLGDGFCGNQWPVDFDGLSHRRGSFIDRCYSNRSARTGCS